MDKIDLVCLCDNYDLKGMFGAGFAARHPLINLIAPDEVTDPTRIRHAFAFAPGPDAFAPYPNLAMVHGAGAGVDALLAHPGLSADMPLRRVVNAEQARMMAGFAAWYVVGWHRRMWDYAQLQSERNWKVVNLSTPSDFPVGILGYGNMGATVARALKAMGFPVTAFAGTAHTDDGVAVLTGPDGLRAIAAQSRAVINLLPLTEATRGILDADFFAAMREDAILIQLGRGEHLVEPDLMAALDRGRPAMAALDVMVTEPLPRDHPFWTHPKIMLTPHVACESDPDRISDWVAEGIRQFERGETPEGLVDREKGY